MKKTKPKNSREYNGKLYVDCAECQRGGNGIKDCSAGWLIKKAKKGGCFSGQLLDKYQDPREA